MPSSLALCVTFLALATFGNANILVKGRSPASSDEVSMRDVEKDLLEEITAALGSSIDARLKDLEAVLRPMYKALPKNEHGNLGHFTVRYALHRFFEERHGWFVKGLEPSHTSENISSPTGILKDRVPSYIEELMEQRLGDSGFGLHETAVLAATLEHLVRDEGVERLQAAYAALGHSLTGTVDEAGIDDILDTFMVLYILGDHDVPNDQIRKYKEQMSTIYPAWSHTQSFIRDIRQNVSTSQFSSAEGGFDITHAMRISEELGERHGRFQNGECIEMKDQLVQLEGHQAGRVRLSDFHGAAFGFTETAEFLNQIGALDESQGGEPSVIVPNYISASSNCIASSSFYSVCCISECEGLLRHLENEIAAPSVDPQRLLKIVATMPSSTVRAPRKLPASLAHQLVKVSEQQSGSVQLHSHLFSEWMHTAYPRECPRPHFSEGKAPMTADEWLESGLNATESMQGISSAGADHEPRQETEVQSSPPGEEPESVQEKPSQTFEAETTIDQHESHDQASRAKVQVAQKIAPEEQRPAQDEHILFEAGTRIELNHDSEDFELVVTSSTEPAAPANRSCVWAMARIVFSVSLLASVAYLAVDKIKLACSASKWHLNSAKKSKSSDYAFAEKAYV